MSEATNGNRYVNLLQEFSLPLLMGVVAAVVFANFQPELYDKIVFRTHEFFTEEFSQGHPPVDEAGEEATAHSSGEVGGNEHEGGAGHGLAHFLTLHFIVNDLFMVLFFGVAAKEITESCLPGGALNPISRAVNPLFGTLGGVVGPIGVFVALNLVIGDRTLPLTVDGRAGWANGWAIPTATDIALAWLVARMVFGTGHPAISFLLLLAVADDGIGLLIIAFFYPSQAPEWSNTLWIVAGMAVAGGLRWMKVPYWLPYIFFGGLLSWWGFFSAHLHPALALVPIVPFLPGPNSDIGFFTDEAGRIEHDPLNGFEHSVKLIVDFGLFFFAFANAGVRFENINELTWMVLLSLLVGKTLGITLFSWVAEKAGCRLPAGMTTRHLFVAGIVAGLGLTVALFVAGEAFKNHGEWQGAAKMGALFSGGVAFVGLLAGRILKVKDGAGKPGAP